LDGIDFRIWRGAQCGDRSPALLRCRGDRRRLNLRHKHARPCDAINVQFTMSNSGLLYIWGSCLPTEELTYRLLALDWIWLVPSPSRRSIVVMGKLRRSSAAVATKARRPPLATIRPGRPVPAIGPGSGRLSWVRLVTFKHRAAVLRLHVDRARRRPARGGGRVGVGESQVIVPGAIRQPFPLMVHDASFGR
jgi:hypothetical protein